ncbi:co-chaperone GroES [Anaerofustis stercorihominis]|jgi:chaperonin GroES|uniref:Co-chaperonin GroES n=2 Tax=Anaerofustis stercorihominis TaxID=214853 RepID=B1C9G0_9FIRM|nr:co-chaperone GroES [Anaerofustis stercorihominis]EDS72531.1 chaperonin GroS [Anaerofustis stercorihominis DSM 17244]MCQ4795234.1 co-chaperone GroES [Anaerofustis stercorihominis]MCR2032872.1 co-chaperone GroES [Anaerofustis stercorihominis]RGD73532.1 co-chaperone GroES [Anaerofustis stercorihominis]
MKLQPLGDKVVIKVKEEEKTTATGIILPDTAKEKPVMGEIVAVGSGEIVDGKKVALDVKEGDTVIYSKYAGSEVKLEGEEYLILRQSDILAIVK